MEFSLDREQRMDFSKTQNDKRESRVWHQTKQDWIKSMHRKKRRNSKVQKELKKSQKDCHHLNAKPTTKEENSDSAKDNNYKKS